MSNKPKTITIDEVKYVRADQAQSTAVSTDGLEYVIIRSRDSGVHAGYLKSRSGGEVELKNSRRIWSWYGAASLSQLAMEGVKKPTECKIAMTLPSLTVLGVCEVIPASPRALASIEGATEWKA